MAELDFLSVGEAMAVFCPDPVRPLREATTLSMSMAGAEANVAVHLAGLGLRTHFCTRVGDDPFGDMIADRLAEAGVEASVDFFTDAPTGVYFKDPRASFTQVHYYRAGSAASTMDVTVWGRVPSARVVHLSGITPALSPSCAQLVATALSTRPFPEAVMSFDVNYRPRLWTPEQAGPVLAEFANEADIVFVGLDEATALWGTETPADVREVLPGPDVLVVKDGGNGATAYGIDDLTFEPALPIEIVEAVGAGDAFAAGYLFGLLTGRSQRERLRFGHHLAAAALGTAADVGAPVTAADLHLLVEDLT